MPKKTACTTIIIDGESIKSTKRTSAHLPLNYDNHSNCSRCKNTFSCFRLQTRAHCTIFRLDMCVSVWRYICRLMMCINKCWKKNLFGKKQTYIFGSQLYTRMHKNNGQTWKIDKNTDKNNAKCGDEKSNNYNNKIDKNKNRKIHAILICI